ncbi:hypothetical protein [Alkalihalobacillus sp. CinArs1]|uniref:hypothetical protein n=1 Tax=Alkalihalobacillus sp. CinArs1 TaxID=2995314 RepID=UPI0022DD5265|nr:hypothetical protein [Alkalihalobacillus sp. CinArs1]
MKEIVLNLVLFLFLFPAAIIVYVDSLQHGNVPMSPFVSISIAIAVGYMLLNMNRRTPKKR